jgi:hypothetical protein
MTDGEGAIIRRPSNGEPWTHKLGPHDNPIAIAAVLTRQVRDALKGGEGRVPGFNRPLHYTKAGWY